MARTSAAFAVEYLLSELTTEFGRVIDSILRADLVLVDELGFSPLGPIAANHLFRLVAGAYETRSLKVTSNWPSSSGPTSCPTRPPRPRSRTDCSHHRQVVVLSGESYRLSRIPLSVLRRPRRIRLGGCRPQ